MGGQIDSILIRKLGGWKLVPVKTWVGWSPGKRQKFLNERNVQFLIGDMPVPDEDAQVLLGLASPHVAPIAAQPEGQATELVPQELVIQESVNVLYARVQQETKQWVVGRYTDPQHGVELSLVRNRNDPSVYDMTTWHGATILSADLIADALGYSADALSLINEQAVEHFKDKFVEPFLGTGDWQVPSIQILESLSLNPFLRLRRPEV